MSPELNVEHVVAIMLDFKRTGDWFYACRNVPARFLRTRWMSGGDSRRFEALYRAHGQLSPITDWKLKPMSPETYRREFARIVEEVMAQEEDYDGDWDKTSQTQ